MFYISKVTGAVIPFDPRATPISVSVQPGSAASQVASEAQVFAEVAARALEVSPVPVSSSAPLASMKGEAVVYEGHAFLTSRPSQGVSDAPHIGRAGAAMAYRTQNAEFHSEEAPDAETITPIGSSDHPHILEDATHAPQRVDPVKDQKPRYRRPVKERGLAIVAADIMSSPVFAMSETASLEEARMVFRERRFRHIPIVSAAGKLVGILSDRDVHEITGERRISGAAQMKERPMKEPAPRERPVIDRPVNERLIKEQMSTDILSAQPQTEIREIAEVMIKHRISCLPVLEESGALVGILTRSDILRAIVARAPLELWS